MIDISSQPILEIYLQKRNLVSQGDQHSVRYCKGGVSGTVAFVDRPGEKPLIVKQALARLNVAETWMCDPNRMKIEYESNRIYHGLLPDCSPEVYFYDEQNYIYGREAVPESCRMWKSDLMSGLIDFEVARKVIETLSTVHNKCANNAGIARRFSNRSIFYELRINPYIEFSVKRHPDLSDAAGLVIGEMMNHCCTLVHGDYSPKNIMVTGRDISVLDYEVAHYGNPAFDLAFLFNHIVLKSIKFPTMSDAFLNLLQFMSDVYFSKLEFMDRSELADCTVRTLALLMIARVDGKSPVEYLFREPKKQELVRRIAFRLLEQRVDRIDRVVQTVRAGYGDFSAAPTETGGNQIEQI